MPGLERQRQSQRQHSRSTGTGGGGGSSSSSRPTKPQKALQSHNSPGTQISYISTHTTAPSSIADRYSFGSDCDALLYSSFSLTLAASPDPDPQKATSLPHNPNDKALEAAEEKEGVDPSQCSFSQALRECQNRRFRSESHSFPKRKPRPASLDLNSNVGDTIISPRFLLGSLTAMKNSSAASSRSKAGSFPSPGTPNYRYQKGWSSERVPPPANSSRRHMAGGLVLPFNNGRAIPSKWEDAEKWIFSPVGTENAGRSSVAPPHHRRPKSKSGPLGPPAYLSSSSAASPLNPCFDSGRVGGFNGSSPFLATVFAADPGSCGGASSGRGGDVGAGEGGGRLSSANAEHFILRSAIVHGWSDTMVESCSSLPSLQGTVQDEKITGNREAGTTLVLGKDVSTQMSLDGSSQSSPKERHSSSQSPSTHPIEELESHFSKLEVRDVQVDDRVTVTRWSKKHVARGSDRRPLNIIEWKKKTVKANTDSSAGWEVAETAKCISKYKREEAKITAWENLQKAKAETAIRKLEMRLEKERASSMDKILNKLRSAQRKAKQMRSAVATIQSQQVVRNTPRRGSYFRRNGQKSSLSGCFTCPAF